MERLEKTVLISAPADQVFSIIEKFEDIPKFSSAISDVKCESDDISTWRIEVGGISLNWRAELLDKVSTRRLKWRSISGLKNRGGYELEQLDNKTKVNFCSGKLTSLGQQILTAGIKQSPFPNL